MPISETKLTELMHGFHDIEPRLGPARPGAIQARVARIRRRRATYAAAATMVVIVAATLLGLPRTRSAPLDPGKAIDLPTAWTASDGVRYRQIAQVEIDPGQGTGASVTVPLSGAPLAVVAACRPHGAPGHTPQSFVQIQMGTDPQVRTTGCAAGSRFVRSQWGVNADLFDFDTTGQAGNVTFTFVERTSVAFDLAPWTIGVYRWEVPSTLSQSPTAAMPAKSGGWRLVDQHNGDWPSSRVVSFSIPANTLWGLLISCPDPLIGANINAFSYSGVATIAVNGTIVSLLGCTAGFTPGDAPSNLTDSPISSTGAVTVTFVAGPCRLP